MKDINLKLAETILPTLGAIANQKMVAAAVEGGVKTPDLEQLHWAEGALMYGSLSLYPPTVYLRAARIAWEEYQQS